MRKDTPEIMNKKLIKTAAIVSAMTLLLAGCGKSSDNGQTTTEAGALQEINIDAKDPQMMNVDPNAVVTKDGQVINDLNGSWYSYEESRKRPVAVMINNLDAAMPQSGIGKADIIYEMLAEGGITRLMAVFSDYSGLDKIGPVRSARQYFDRRGALEHDAIFVHFGDSYLAAADFETYPIDHLDGMTQSGFYRDNSRVAPHNAYTSADLINQMIESNGFRTEKKDDYKSIFSWNVNDTDLPEGSACNKLVTAYHSSRKPWFEYDAETKTYKRFQYGGPQIDDQTGEQLAFKNVIVQFVEHTIPVEGDYLIDLTLVGSGDAYIATDGKITAIKWEKDDMMGVTRYTYRDGTPVRLNPGKTWVTMFHNDQIPDVTFE